MTTLWHDGKMKDSDIVISPLQKKTAVVLFKKNLIPVFLQ